jgi:hypothetical protein
MTTKRNMAERARVTGRPAAWQPSALYRGAGVRRFVVCPATLSEEPGGQITQSHAFRLGGGLRRDNSQIQT